jgi:hypothetical protein
MMATRLDRRLAQQDGSCRRYRPGRCISRMAINTTRSPPDTIEANTTESGGLFFWSIRRNRLVLA